MRVIIKLKFLPDRIDGITPNDNEKIQVITAITRANIFVNLRVEKGNRIQIKSIYDDKCHKEH